jgi:hypothetical protein
LPDLSSIASLVGPDLAEQHDEWADGGRYLDIHVSTRSQSITQD